MLITQRPAKLHKDSLTQVEALIALRLIAPQDRRAVQEWIEDQADADQGKEIIGSLPMLKTGEGWVWAPEINMLERMRFPALKTFDSSKAPDTVHDGDAPVLAPIDLGTIQAKLEHAAVDEPANDPARLKKRIAELEKEIRSGSAKDADLQRTQAYEQGKADGFRAGLEHAAAEMAKASAALVGHAPPKSTIPLTVQGKPSPSKAPVSKPVSDTLSNPQRRILRSLHFWASVGQDNPSREQVAGVAGYSPGSGGFNNLVGALKSAGLVGSRTPGTLCLMAHDDEYGMTPAEAQAMLSSVLSNPHRKILDAFSGGESLSREEVAQRSGYSAGSGGFNNLVGRLNTLTLLERPTQGKLALSDWAIQVLG